jgi:hypothetical protein
VLELIDAGLEAMLRARVPLSAQDVDVSFEAPDKDWAAKLNRPTVNLFMWDVKRSADHARTGVERFERDGVQLSRMALPRIELRYLITAWTSEHRDERALLSGLLRSVLATPVLPETFLAPMLRELSPVKLLLARSGDINIDVFKQLDGKLKPALDVVVITEMDLGLETVLPAAPTEVGIGVSDRERPTRTSSVRRIAGEVLAEGAVGALVRAPHAVAVVNETGRFLIDARPGDEIVLETEPPLRAIVPAQGGVVIGSR